MLAEKLKKTVSELVRSGDNKKNGPRRISKGLSEHNIGNNKKSSKGLAKAITTLIKPPTKNSNSLANSGIATEKEINNAVHHHKEMNRERA